MRWILGTVLISIIAASAIYAYEQKKAAKIRYNQELYKLYLPAS